MAEYLIYGKRVEEWWNPTTRRTEQPDKTFRALDQHGCRVTKLQDAFSFATKEDAQEFLDAHKQKPGTVFEIRKAK